MVLTQTFIQSVGKFLHQALTLKERWTCFCNQCEQPVEAALLQWLLSFLSLSRRGNLVLASSFVGSLLLPLSCLQQPQPTLLFWQETPPNGTHESWNPFLIAVLSACSIRSSLQILLCKLWDLVSNRGDLWGVHEDGARLRNCSLSGG